MAFPTTPMHGKLAKITNAGTVIDYSSRWSINVTRDVAVVARQGQEYKEASPGQRSWTGTAEFTFVNSSEQSSAIGWAIGTSTTPSLSTTIDSSVVAFCFDTTLNRLVGNIICSGLTIDAPVGDVIKANFTFQGSGPISFKDA